MRVRDCPQCDERRARIAPKCNKCGCKMKPSTALVNDIYGRLDGRPAREGDTLNITGATLRPCWKCPKCGRSIKR